MNGEERQCSARTERKKKAVKKADVAVDLYNRGFHCSQAVLAAFADELGVTEEVALRLGSCLGTGMRKGEVCGACTGALMALGLKYGQDREGDAESRQRSNRVCDKLMERFSEANGSWLCNDLLGHDVTTPHGLQVIREQKLFTVFCPQMVRSAAEIVEQIMKEESDACDEN